MRKALLVVAALCLLVTTAGGVSSAPPGVSLIAEDTFNVEGATVALRLRNEGQSPVVMSGKWRITDLRGDDWEATHLWTEEQRTLDPGEERVWSWGQRRGCFGACENAWEGRLVRPSIYRLSLWVDGQWIARRFQVGQFFTLGFDGYPEAKFVVFVNRPGDVDAMKGYAGKSSDEQPIISGIVRSSQEYNPAWSYTMAPGSIILADVFIEVCDASPHYIEENRDGWLGQRWCPWGSYVEKVGR